MKFILPCVILGIFTADAPAVSSTGDCPVTIEVGGSELLSACSVDPTLHSGGANIIYIPTRPPRDFVVERLDPQTLPGVRFESEVVQVTKRVFAGYPPLRYDFKSSRVFALDWCKVGAPRPEDAEDCIVPPGVYRVAIVYSLSDPSKGRGRERQLCRAFSPAFRLKQSCGVTTFHEDNAASKPNNRLKQTARGRSEAEAPRRTRAAV